MYMQTNQTIINIKGIVESLPSTFSFDLIFLTAVILSNTLILLSIILYKNKNYYGEFMKISITIFSF